MATAGFYWCGSESQPDLARCFVCLKDFEGWEPNDIPKYKQINASLLVQP
jgi:baculoviral IAP repeat-containing protein 5